MHFQIDTRRHEWIIDGFLNITSTGSSNLGSVCAVAVHETKRFFHVRTTHEVFDVDSHETKKPTHGRRPND
jgi:hypothetical protein